MSCSPDKGVMYVKIKWSRPDNVCHRPITGPWLGSIARQMSIKGAPFALTSHQSNPPSSTSQLLDTHHTTTSMCSCTTSIAVPTVQHTTVLAAPTTPAIAASTEKPALANYNGPQCCHCGWRGGGHDKCVPFESLFQPSLILSSSRCPFKS